MKRSFVPLPGKGALAIAALIATVMGLGLCGCSSSKGSSASTSAQSSGGSSSSAPQGTGAAAARALLPANVRSKGYLSIVTDTSFGPPWDFNPENSPSTFNGIDPDVMRGVAQALGVQIHWTISPFDGIIPALKAGRYDMAVNGMTDSADREKQIDMIHYINDSDTIVVAKGNPKGITGLASLCGQTVAVATGTHEADIVQQYQPRCAKKMTINLYPSNGPTFLAVESGRAVATINGYAATAYLQKTNAAGFKGLQGLLNVRLGANPVGIGVSKTESGVTKAVAAALDAMIADGTYTKILTKWGMAANGLKQVAVNSQSGSGS